MTDGNETTDRLERVLHALSDDVDLGTPYDVASTVRARIERAPVSRQPTPRLRFVGNPAAFGATAAIVALSAFMIASSGARHAVADWLGVSGIRITVGPPPAGPPAEELELGTRTTLEQARSRVEFDISLPADLGGPDEVYFDDFPAGGQVSLVYNVDEDLPSSGAPGAPHVAVLVNEFAGTVDPIYAKKSVPQEASVEPVSVNGVPGYWIEGEHFIYLLEPDGTPRTETVRLAANVLLWEMGGVTFRLESALPLERALEIAESMP